MVWTRLCCARCGRSFSDTAGRGCRITRRTTAQEVCLALIAARHGQRDGLPAGRTVTAYAFGIAQHKMADAMRASARLAMSVPDLRDIADHRPGPEETVLARWEGEQVRRALAQLPPPQRHLLLLRVVSGFTAAETGAVLGMSAEAVRVAQHRALARMRKLLASEPS